MIRADMEAVDFRGFLCLFGIVLQLYHSLHTRFSQSVIMTVQSAAKKTVLPLLDTAEGLRYE